MTSCSIRAGWVVAAGFVAFCTGCEPFELHDDHSEAAQTQRATVVDTYQAEDHTFQNSCSIRSNHHGYTGSGFMDYGGNGSIVEWGRVNVPAAGQYTLTFRYANGSGHNRRCRVTVNDTNEIGDVAFGPTGAWTTWGSTSIKATLKAGRNKIRVTASSGTGGPNLDKMDLSSANHDGGDGAGECVETNEGSTAILSCPPGELIDSIDFASYGVPLGSCSADFSTGACHASSSLGAVETECLNRQSCTVAANNATFGDPCYGTHKKLAVNYSCSNADGDGGPGNDMPVFLLAGQSNMEGNVNTDLFHDLLDELERSPRATRQQRLEDRLTRWYLDENDGYARYGYSERMVAFESSEFLRLATAGLVSTDIARPYQNVWCAMNDNAIEPLAINCGHPFGPELALGHYLGTTDYLPTSLIKVAKGGSTLNVDWLSPTSAARTGKPVGAMYKALRRRIRSIDSAPGSVHPDCNEKNCRWAAFIWFQGENDCFELNNADAYEQNLTDLIADIRSEAGTPSLPVIVVQIGAWAQSMTFGDVVADAQQAVADSDPYATLVATDDLSGFYHYDPAAQLVIGERVARALLAMLD